MLRTPPGRPEKPLALVAFALMGFQGEPVVIILLLAATSPPKKSFKVAHSAPVEMCQPCGANPLGSVTAYQLYSFP